MPLYEYVCKDCGQRFDAMRSMKDADSPILCKHCQGDRTQRALSVFYAASDGRSVTTSSSGGGCAGCGGGSCAGCGGH